MYKVLIPQDVNQEGKDFLIEKGYEVVVGSGFDPETIKREATDADALLVRTAQYPADVIAAGKKLKIIARYGVGTDNIDVKAAEAQGVYVTIAKNCNVDSVAEGAMALLLACAKNLVHCHTETEKGNWAIRNKLPGAELKGKTLGVIGLGAIGSSMAKKCYYGLDMNVIGYDAFMNPANIPDFITMCGDMQEVLMRADAITLHIPATPESVNLVNADMMAKMKKSAILINTARGGIVNEDDVYEALKSGVIGSYGADVFTEEPPVTAQKLFSLPNFVASPHNAGLTTEAGIAMAVSAAQAIHDVLSGNKPLYPINNPKV